MGETTLAVSNIIRSFYMIIAIPVFALASTANTLVSNTIGAGKQNEVISLIWKVSQFSLMIVFVFILLIGIFPKTALSIYTTDVNLIRQSIPSLYVILFVVPIMAIGNVFFSSVSGTGNTRPALYIEIIALFLYSFWVWFTAVHIQAPLAVCWTAELVYAVFIGFFSFVYFKRGKWVNKQI